jgi:uncharacterized repeat protein (TIGR03803 family)
MQDKTVSRGRNVALSIVPLSIVPVSIAPVAIIAVAIVTLILCALPAWAGEGTEKALHNFNPHQGTHPSSVILGPDGNIYGITVIGGANGVGTVYELTPAAGGRWLETKVIDFGRKGNFPNTVMVGAGGNLFGSEEEGPSGCGGIFELTLDSAGHWQETILHDFSCAEGLYPESALVRDGAGNLYGTAWGGGTFGDGTVFELSPAAGAGWSFRVLHSFDGTDGAHPQTAVAIDGSGNLYGTALCGGSSAGTLNIFEFPPDCGGAVGVGTVWELSPQSDGSWGESTIYNFAGGTDGANPSAQGQLIFDMAGNLYGTTHNGGTHGLGTTYELSPNGDGTWSEKILHSFTGEDGIAPSGNVIADGTGNLYGETFGPGCYLGCGAGGESGGQLVYKLSPNADGSWTETVMHRFDDPVSGGPSMGLIMDAAGNLYGTTWMGGAYNNGVVFEITP